MAEYDFIKMEKKLAKYLDEDRYAQRQHEISYDYQYDFLDRLFIRQRDPSFSLRSSVSIISFSTKKKRKSVRVQDRSL